MAELPPFEMIEHTADAAIVARGHDLRELIANAAAGMLAVLYREAPGSPTQFLEFAVEAETPELLVQHCLRELIYLMEDEGLAPVSVEVSEASEKAAKLKVGVLPREQAEPFFSTPVKAITRHGLQIERPNGLLAMTLVFDV